MASTSEKTRRKTRFNHFCSTVYSGVASALESLCLPQYSRISHCSSEVRAGDYWLYDTGAASHVCNDKSQFKTYKEESTIQVRIGNEVCAGKAHIAIANGSLVNVVGIGDVDLKFPSGEVITLVDVKHAPDIVENLISGVCMDNEGFKLVIESGNLILSKNNVFIGKGYHCKGSYRMDLINSDSDYISESLPLWVGRL